ncbi:hypothetical protein HELRODRAFT_172434 [Helobdella robusta]|uniref:Homeobox domain-containing protein n=1 Tax=Helobdella robusta TaxID=6412 RepID=T1F5B8_HELRO|nr:hypothetical protein HELRODRAFT_172434 [Helobdella robusta]ESO04762.1 hypothetical protein HELRODRAFT_172434 [Helobdella robusta]
MILSPDAENWLKTRLCETILLLCKSGLKFESQFSVDGLLAVTIDRNEVLLVNIREVVDHNNDDSGNNNNNINNNNKNINNTTTVQKKCNNNGSNSVSINKNLGYVHGHNSSSSSRRKKVKPSISISSTLISDDDDGGDNNNNNDNNNILNCCNNKSTQFPERKRHVKNNKTIDNRNSLNNNNNNSSLTFSNTLDDLYDNSHNNNNNNMDDDGDMGGEEFELGKVKVEDDYHYTNFNQQQFNQQHSNQQIYNDQSLNGSIFSTEQLHQQQSHQQIVLIKGLKTLSKILIEVFLFQISSNQQTSQHQLQPLHYLTGMLLLNNFNFPYPDWKTCESLASQCGISSSKVNKWFSNRRNRDKNTRNLTDIANRRGK